MKQESMVETKVDGKFKCKKCTQWKSREDARMLVVTQMNKPLEFEHVKFSSKEDIMICKECYKIMERA